MKVYESVDLASLASVGITVGEGDTMAIKTDIEYCDSTLNTMMGCDGCELWNRKAGVLNCYAGQLTDRYGGLKGWPKTFEEPALFLDRLDKALRWSDLTGTDRPDRPWLNGMPRVIFMNDMGDTFTESLPIDWLAPLLPKIAESPHQFMILTKRAKRMRQFCESHPLPNNVWPGVSVTSQATAGRIADLAAIQSGGPKWISAEPLLGPVDLAVPWDGELTLPTLQADLVVAGGESGQNARPCHPGWVRSIRDQCQDADASFFFKQWGEWGAVHHPIGGAADDAINGRIDARYGEWHDDGEFVESCLCGSGHGTVARVGKKSAGRLLDGREWSEMPEVINATTN